MTRRTLTLKSPTPQGQPIDEVVERICNNCKFWSQSHNECRRRPPFMDWQTAGEGRWPKTAATHWCGEFKRLPIERP